MLLALGTPARARRWAAWMREQDVVVHAIRPPTVPAGGARLRMTVTARHEPADIERALAAVRQVACG